jgi:tRNA threonylcarbamoyladenosine biosynthesis protein TsaE
VLQFVTNDAEETKQIGRVLAAQLPRRGVALLIGNLGAGKTTIASGIIEGLGLAGSEDVNSPTYTIVHEYGEPVSVYHIDLYRLETAREVLAIGFDDLLDSDALLLIEWGERFPALLPMDRIEIHLNQVENDDRRSITVVGLGF